MSYQTITVKPIAGAMGAEIQGVDLKSNLDNQTWSEIHKAFLDHQAIYFRGQDLGPDDVMEFGRHFGDPTLYPFVKGIEGYPHIFEIIKEPHEAKNFGGNWHSDSTYMEKPPLGTLLYCKEAPTHGGDTLVANQYLAYEALSDAYKKMLDGLIGIYSAGLKNSGGRDAGGSHKTMKIQNTDNAGRIQAEHPLVRTHPGTGRKSLYVNGIHTICIKGWTEAESAPILKFLSEHAARPEFTCRIKWEAGTVGIWDNRCTQHFAINDYSGQRRVMQRLTVGAELPVA